MEHTIDEIRTKEILKPSIEPQRIRGTLKQPIEKQKDGAGQKSAPKAQ
jgi:hypothetical protein